MSENMGLLELMILEIAMGRSWIWNCYESSQLLPPSAAARQSSFSMDQRLAAALDIVGQATARALCQCRNSVVGAAQDRLVKGLSLLLLPCSVAAELVEVFITCQQHFVSMCFCGHDVAGDDDCDHLTTCC